MDNAGNPESEQGGIEGESADQSPAEFTLSAFELVTAETRAAILEALAAHQAENPRAPALEFTELREATGVEDSGNFNYHLGKLQPEYVRKTADGYSLTYAGLSLVGSLRAGVLSNTTLGPETLDANCAICEAELTAKYEEGLLSVACSSGHLYPRNVVPSNTVTTVPPNAVADRTLGEVVTLQTRRLQYHCELVRDGVCPACFSDVERDHEVLAQPQGSHIIIATCEGCGMVSAAPVGMSLLREPAVVAFYHDHDIDVTETPFWPVDLPITEPVVVSEDPLRLSLSVEHDDERLTLIVDEHAQLIDSERTSVDM